jgi:aspartate racemase
MKKLGIAGGLGPHASAHFYKMLTRLTRAETDQEHIECILYSAPQIPDRSAFFRGTESPLDGLLRVCRILEQMADVIAIPCMTAHHFYDELAGAVSVPILDMHRICAEKAGAGTLGVMATDGTLKSGRLQAILREHGITPVLPENSVMRLIYGIKAGKPLEPDAFAAEVRSLETRGAEKILLACTELSIYKGTMPYLDASELLARRCIQAVGGTMIDQCP